MKDKVECTVFTQDVSSISTFFEHANSLCFFETYFSNIFSLIGVLATIVGSALIARKMLGHHISNLKHEQLKLIFELLEKKAYLNWEYRYVINEVIEGYCGIRLTRNATLAVFQTPDIQHTIDYYKRFRKNIDESVDDRGKVKFVSKYSMFEYLGIEILKMLGWLLVATISTALSLEFKFLFGEASSLIDNLIILIFPMCFLFLGVVFAIFSYRSSLRLFTSIIKRKKFVYLLINLNKSQVINNN